MCRPLSGQARSERWFAVDCPDCKAKLLNKRVVCRDERVGVIEALDVGGVWIDVIGGIGEFTDYRTLDMDWAPMPSTEEIFGKVEL